MRQGFGNIIKSVLFAFLLCALTACGLGAGYRTAQEVAGAVSQAPKTAAPVSAPQAEKIKVGILLPLSGPHQALGQALFQSAQLALFDIGYENVELVPRDVGSTPAQAVQAANSAIDSGAQLLLGPVFSPSVRAVKPVAERAGVNVISFTTDWTLAGGNVYVLGFTPFDQVERITRYASAQNLRNVSVFAPEDVYGRMVTGAFSTLAPRYGVTISAKGSFPAQGGDVAPYVARFSTQAVSSSAVLLPAGGAQAVAVARQLRGQGLQAGTVRILGTGLFDETTGESLLRGNPDLNGAWFPAPAPALRRKFEDRYTALYGVMPPRIATLAYDATALAVVLARMGAEKGTGPAYDRSALMNPNGWSGIDGIFRFKPNGVAERGLAVLGFETGQIVLLEEAPKTFQTAVP